VKRDKLIVQITDISHDIQSMLSELDASSTDLVSSRLKADIETYRG
jgi:vacuolar-type H+-ATPase subunit D/Vma8